MDHFPLLVGDIGGTYTRFALVTHYDTSRGYQLAELNVFTSADYASIDDILAAYLSDLGKPRPRHACIAVAGPVSGDTVRPTNVDWVFSVKVIRERFAFARLEVINDFAALAFTAVLLHDSDLTTIKPGRAELDATKAVIGPGTGFGAAALVPGGDKWYPMAGEGGHASFAPCNATELKILKVLSREHEHVSVETLLCGRGLVTLYRTLAEIWREPPILEDPAQIIAAALEKSHDLCDETICLFTSMLASVAGDLALTYGAKGGVYLGGGIAPRIQSYLTEQDFIDRFQRKGVMSGYLQNVPIYLITHEQPALLGGAAWLEQRNGLVPTSRRTIDIT